jgi:hypothetical protein
MTRGAVMRSSHRLAGSPLRHCVEQFDETRLVRITRGGFAIWLNPFGMLDPEVVVNLLPKLGVVVDLVSYRHCLRERFKCAAWRNRSGCESI